MGFNFKQLAFVANCPQMPRNVDLLVIIAEMGDYGEINTKNGLRGKRNVVLLDRSVNDEKAD